MTLRNTINTSPSSQRYFMTDEMNRVKSNFANAHQRSTRRQCQQPPAVARVERLPIPALETALNEVINDDRVVRRFGKEEGRASFSAQGERGERSAGHLQDAFLNPPRLQAMASSREQKSGLDIVMNGWMVVNKMVGAHGDAIEACEKHESIKQEPRRCGSVHAAVGRPKMRGSAIQTDRRTLLQRWPLCKGLE